MDGEGRDGNKTGSHGHGTNPAARRTKRAASGLQPAGSHAEAWLTAVPAISDGVSAPLRLPLRFFITQAQRGGDTSPPANFTQNAADAKPDAGLPAALGGLRLQSARGTAPVACCTGAHDRHAVVR